MSAQANLPPIGVEFVMLSVFILLGLQSQKVCHCKSTYFADYNSFTYIYNIISNMYLICLIFDIIQYCIMK